MSRKPVRLLLVFLILIYLLAPSLADTYHAPDLNEAAEETTVWSERPVYDDHYNESYPQPGNMSSGNIGGIENSTLNVSTQLNDGNITTFPIEDAHHVATIGLCATLLVIFGIIIVKN